MIKPKSLGIALGWPRGGGLAASGVPITVIITGDIPVNAIRFSDNTGLQFSDGQYLEFAS